MTEFVNPYNFIPFGNGPTQKTEVETYGSDSRELLYGWMTVRLTVKQPIIIPSEYPYDNNGHKTYGFFKFPDGSLGIPGSSLRGMIRSVYEAASDSCMPFVMDNDDITLRTPTYAAYKERGLLGYDKEKGWTLYEAEVYKVDDSISKHNLRTKISGGCYHPSDGGLDRKNGDRVKYRIKDAKKKLVTLVEDGEDGHEGWIQFNSPPALKDDAHYYVRVLTPIQPIPLFAYDPENPEKQAIDRQNLYGDLLKTLESTVGKDDNSAPSPQSFLKEKLEAVKNGRKGMIPVWYQKVTRSKVKDKYNTEDAVYYLSPSAIGRVSMHRKWEEIMGRHAPCQREKGQELKLCPACWLFGNVREDRRNIGAGFQLRGRLRFTDALPYADVKLLDDIQHLRILSQPRPSAYEFYLGKPDDEATYWNYDYSIVPIKNGEDTEYEYRYCENPVIRGRKFYWHSNRQYTLHNPEDSEYGNSKQNSSFDAVTEGSQFEFKIYFDGITNTQLNQLKWVVTLGDNSLDSVYQHKLGHGRPLGYGSVKLMLVSTSLRTIKAKDRSLSYLIEPSVNNEATVKFDWPMEPGQPEPAEISALRAMADCKKTVGKIVSYPLGVSKVNNGGRYDVAIFSWFAKNRSRNVSELPMPTSRDIVLKTYDHFDKRSEQNYVVSADDFERDPVVPLNQQLARSDNESAQRRGNGNRSPRTGDQGQPGGASHQNRQWQREKPAPGPGKLTGDTIDGRIKKIAANGGAYIDLPDAECDGFLHSSIVKKNNLHQNDWVKVFVKNISVHATYDLVLKGRTGGDI